MFERKWLWKQYFSLPHVSENKQFAGSITTNGVEICFLFARKKEKQKQKEKESTGLKTIGKKGLYQANEVIVTENMNVVGLDPGYNKILTATDDESMKSRKDRHVVELKSTTRADQIGLKQYRQWLQGSKTQKLCDAEQTIPSRKFGVLSDVLNYIRKRSQVEDRLRKFYNRVFWKHQKWKRKRKKQEWQQEVVATLTKEFKKEGKETVIAWGNGTQNSHNLAIKGYDRSPQKSLRNFVAKFLPVVVTSEYNTTKDCSHSECMKLNPVMKTEPVTMKDREGKDKVVQEIRYCANSSTGHSGHFVSRDYNAAVNIRKRLLTQTRHIGPYIDQNGATLRSSSSFGCIESKDWKGSRLI